MVARTDAEVFEIGPLSGEVKKAAAQIRLVLKYAEQDATLNALNEICKKTSFSPESAIFKLEWLGIASGEFEDIRHVAGNAPLFKQLVAYLRKINDESIIPEKHIPGDKLVNKIVADYHAWVEEQSKR